MRMCEACLALNRTCDGIASHVRAMACLAPYSHRVRPINHPMASQGDSTLRLPRQPAWNDAGGWGHRLAPYIRLVRPSDRPMACPWRFHAEVAKATGME